jgi:hypothetical protein
MKGFDTLYRQTVTVMNIEYEVYSCCNGKRLCLVIEPTNTSFMIGSVILIREINNGLVDWLDGEDKSYTFKPLLTLANEIALETDKLMKKVYKMRIFS